MPESESQISKTKRSWLIIRMILSAFGYLAIIPFQLGVYLLITGVNPLHTYEPVTCQATLKFGGLDLPPEERDTSLLEFDLIESPPFRDIKQTIDHQNYTSKFCSANYIDLFGKENLVACYKSKQSGKLTINNPFQSRWVIVLSGLIAIIILLGPFRLAIQKIRVLLANGDLSKYQKSNLTVSHWFGIAALSAIFLSNFIKKDIAHSVGNNWQKFDCWIVANCKSEEETYRKIVYEYSTPIGMIRSNQIHLFGLQSDEGESQQLNSFAVGDSVPCFVNPEAPQQSFLFPAKPFSADRYVIFFLVLGLWCWKGWPYLKARARKSAESEPPPL